MVSTSGQYPLVRVINSTATAAIAVPHTMSGTRRPTRVDVRSECRPITGNKPAATTRCALSAKEIATALDVRLATSNVR
jgi:hypothetical protein